MPLVKIADVKTRAVAVLMQAGVCCTDAEDSVDHMLAADLRGRSSHGLSVRFHYILRLAKEGAGARRAEVVRDDGQRVVVDARNGLGYPAGRLCATLLIERARRHGAAAVALRNSRHTGMIGYYVDMAARAGVVAMAFGNCCPLMAPWGGSRALLGTNPLAFGFPAEPDPIIVDMATSAVTYGEVLELQRAGKELPDGCALDPQGNPTRDPAAARDGALLPFGGHRGGALAVAVQLLAGALTGAPPVPPSGQGYGLLMVGFERGAFAGAQGYDAAVQEFVRQYLAVPPRPGETVRLPGARRWHGSPADPDATIQISGQVAEMLGMEGPS